MLTVPSHTPNYLTNEHISMETTSSLEEKSTDEIVAMIKEIKDEKITQENPTARARISKRLKQLFDILRTKSGTLSLQLELAQDMSEWARSQNINYLRINLEMRLARILFEHRQHQKSLSLINSLHKELKKMDDKLLLVEVQLLESQVYHSVMNIPKAKASLTGARALANTVYCAPEVQAALDLHAGILHAEEGDFRTAYSFFYEAVEAKPNENISIACRSLIYLLITLLLLDRVSEIDELLSVGNAGGWKAGLSTAQVIPKPIEIIQKIAKAVIDRSLSIFEGILSHLMTDPLLDEWCMAHLKTFAGTLLQTNLQALVAPYSRVQISFLASRLGLPLELIISRLSQMILDKQLKALIDQGSDTLQMLEDSGKDEVYHSLLLTISHLENSVDALERKAVRLASK